MNDSNSPSSNARPERPAWNTGKLTGPKPPLRPGHVWLIRAKLQLEKRTRDLALFNLAIDSKLRGCDLVALRVDDVAPNGYAVEQRAPAEDWSARSVRTDGGDAPGGGRLSCGSVVGKKGSACSPAALACWRARVGSAAAKSSHGECSVLSKSYELG